MHTTSSPAVDGDPVVDELVDALSALVRAWRSAGRQLPDHTTMALLQLAGHLRDGEHRLGEIAERRGVDQSVVSRQVSELQLRGLVCRRPDPSDGRAHLVRLTPAGEELLARAARLKRDVVRGAVARSPSADVPAVARFVAGLAAEFDARAAEPLLPDLPVPAHPEKDPS
ncbi:MAG: MarR family winged helix-turn-helix transcriptional regulator [Pseudonocardiales bacterium]|nr:MarR family winged helix-turn-helix transcriptional regulator [Pseudonocardiales bacterium]